MATLAILAQLFMIEGILGLVVLATSLWWALHKRVTVQGGGE